MTFGLALVVINRHEIDLQLRALFALLIHLHFDMRQLLSLGSSESRRPLLQQCYEDSSVMTDVNLLRPKTQQQTGRDVIQKLVGRRHPSRQPGHLSAAETLHYVRT